VPEQTGILIVLEGADGAGKSTQFRLLSARLKAVGHEVSVYKFPRYEETSSYFIKKYLNGDYGPAVALSPYVASLFYALDRFEAGPLISKDLEAGKVVLCDRYVGSNMAHQGSKFGDETEQRGFFLWNDNLEFQLLQIPRPNVSLFLRVPAEISQKLMAEANRTNRNYTAKSHDEHEKDSDYLRKTIATFDVLCGLFPRDFKAIDCTKDAKLLAITEINNQIWDVVRPLLPTSPPHKSKKLTLRLSDGGLFEPSPQKNIKPPAKKALKNPDQSSKTAGLQEFKVRQLSWLAASSLEALPGVSIDWQLKPIQNKPSYFKPAGLPKTLQKQYIATMDRLFGLYFELQAEFQKIQKPLLKMAKSKNRSTKSPSKLLTSVLPLAAYAPANIQIKSPALPSIITELATHPLTELQQLAIYLSEGVDKQKFPEQRSSLAKPESIQSLVQQLVEARLAQNLPHSDEAVKLVELQPRNEFELLVEAGDAQLDSSTYQQKEAALKAALKRPSSRLLDQVTYRWDVVAERSLLSELQKQKLVKDLRVQSPTPRFGYEVPEPIEEWSLDKLFTDCFELSLELYSQLQAAGQEYIASYATLSGHKIRWQFTCSGAALAEAQAKINQSSPPLKQFMNQLLEKVSEKHATLSQFLADSSAAAVNGSHKSPTATAKAKAGKRLKRN